MWEEDPKWQEANFRCFVGGTAFLTRKARINLMHQHLQLDAESPEFPNGKPRLAIFNNCSNLIQTLPCLVHSKADPEDIKQVDDHCFDGITYGLQKAFGTTGKVRIRGF